MQRLSLEQDLPGFDLRQLEQVFENQVQPVALLENDVEELCAGLRIVFGAIEQGFDISLDRRERGPQLVGHVGDEIFSDNFQAA